MTRYLTSEGIIINLKSVGEKDYLVTVLTADFGKIRLLAKGVKTLKSQRLRSLQQGNTVRLQYYKKNDFYWLNEIVTLSQFLHHQKSLTQLNLMFYFLEIINQFVADNQQIEGIYRVSLNTIESISRNRLTELVGCEIELINVLGFGVPAEIVDDFNRSDLIGCQKKIKLYLESIMEKPLKSSKLFQ